MSYLDHINEVNVLLVDSSKTSVFPEMSDAGSCKQLIENQNRCDVPQNIIYKTECMIYIHVYIARFTLSSLQSNE